MIAEADPFEIVALEPHGKAASNGKTTVCLAEKDGRMFRRRAVKKIGSAEAHSIEWLVVELDGVKVYVDKENIVVTRRNMNP